MADEQKRGRKPAAEPMPDAKQPLVARKTKNIIGTGMPYVPPVRDVWAGTALGYRPKAKKRRPSLYPNMA